MCNAGFESCTVDCTHHATFTVFLCNNVVFSSTLETFNVLVLFSFFFFCPAFSLFCKNVFNLVHCLQILSDRLLKEKSLF